MSVIRSPRFGRSRRHRLAPALALLAGTALTACTLAPDYQRPASPVTAAWPTGPAYGPDKAAATPSPLAAGPDGWKDVFRSPRLQALIARALDNNRDLRVAALNIEVARATYRVQESAALPTVNAQTSGTRTRTPGNTQGFSQALTLGQYKVGVGVTSYELDLFGRVHSLSEQALESFLSTTEARNSTRLSLVAQVATAYLTLCSDRDLLALTRQTLDTQVATHQRNQRLHDQGIATGLDLLQSQGQVDTARANVEAYERQVAQDRNALELLVGAPLSDAEVADEGLAAQDVLADLPAGLPSDLLLNRPDIREAEHTLKAANANIGAARAAFFPQITLTGFLGTESGDIVGLFSKGTAAWTFAPNMTMPLFDYGKNSANLASAKANRDIAVAQYEKAIQTGFREVADALAARDTLERQLKAQSAVVASAKASLDLSNKRFAKGLDTYLTVLDSQRSLYTAQQTEVSLRLSLLSNRATLFKALGGSEHEEAREE